MLLGFAEDYRQVLLNVPQELVLKRASDDSDAVQNTLATEALNLTIHNVVWRVPHIRVDMQRDLQFTRLQNKNVLMEMFFRGWEYHENSSIPETTKHSWSVKTAPHLETPRYIILAFQTGRKGKWDKNMSKFDPISLTDVTVYLNGKRYPYENVRADFEENRISVLYNMYSRFQNIYYQYADSEPYLKYSQFKLCPLIGIDCSHQDDVIHKGGVEVRIEIATKSNIPKDTTLSCLILHNKLYEYSAFNKMVQRKY